KVCWQQNLREFLSRNRSRLLKSPLRFRFRRRMRSENRHASRPRHNASRSLDQKRKPAMLSPSVKADPRLVHTRYFLLARQREASVSPAEVAILERVLRTMCEL